MAFQQALVPNDTVRYVERTEYESLCPCCNVRHQVIWRDGQWVFEYHVRRLFGYRMRQCEVSGKPVVNSVCSREGVYVQRR